MRNKFSVGTLFILIFSLTACLMPASLTPDPPSISTIYASVLQTLTPQVPSSTEALSEAHDLETNISKDSQPLVFVQEGIPESFYWGSGLDLYQTTNDENLADIRLHMSLDPELAKRASHSDWVYLLAAPFYTIQDDISLDDLIALLHGDTVSGYENFGIIMTKETAKAMSALFEWFDETEIQVVGQDHLQMASLSNQLVLSIMPFEELTQQWKVLQINGISPIDDEFIPDDYPLTAHIFLETDRSDLNLSFYEGNYDGAKRTVLIMTGVTALTRATAHKMETNGVNYPGQDIRQWLINADITHISNEIPFAENCPYPDPNQPDLVFCSNPDYIGLLQDIGADIIELSGNHILDYGVPAANLTLEMYEVENWLTFAGGRDITEAQSPAIVTHNGNNLAFIGCNLVGPARDWATVTQPGSAPCEDFNWMKAKITDLKAEGYLPIVTIQYTEDYTAYPSAQMEADFSTLAQAGAVVVNGSQAHTPKIMVFEGGTFIHYGLGNLFFDQMAVYYNETLMVGTRDEFIDRLIFYDGQLISVELLTAKLEDYARPRPMTPEERAVLLSRIFEYAPIP